MQKTKKRFLGLVSLLLVAVMTIVAYYIPTPNAAAVGDSVTETIRVVVYDKYPSATVVSPENGDAETSPSVDIKLDYENTSSIKFTLKYYQINETTGEEELVEIPLEDFVPEPRDEVFDYASGSTTYNLDLSQIAGGLGYGKYYLHIESHSPIGYDEDDIEFYYAPAIVTQIGADEETNDPVVDVEYAEGVKKVVVEIYDENGNKISEEEITVENADANLGRGEKTGLVLPFGSYGLDSGTYYVKAVAYDKDGNAIGSPLSSFKVVYEKPAPIVPDTGRFLGNLNISSADYAITVVLAFVLVALFALMILKKKNKKDYRKNFRNRR